MGIVNRRNAVVGWAVLKVGKRAAKKKAQGLTPSARTGGAAAGAAGALGGLLFFWRKKRSSGDTGE
jgi:hypothetical protein